MDEDLGNTDAALIRNDLKHIREIVEDGFDGTNARLDKVNGTVAENVKTIHDVDRRVVAIETTCKERAKSGLSEAKTTEVKPIKLPDSSALAKYGVSGAVGLGGATLIIMLLLRAWGYL